MEKALTKGNSIALATNVDSPSFAICIIKEETEKAIQLYSIDTNFTTWLPKKALKPHRTGTAYTFEMWFRKINNGNSIKTAFNLF